MRIRAVKSRGEKGKGMRLFHIAQVIFGVSAALAQGPGSVAYRDEPLLWQVKRATIAWAFDEQVAAADIKRVNQALELTLASTEGSRGKIELGEPEASACSGTPFQKMGLARAQQEKALVPRRAIGLSPYRRDSLVACKKALASFAGPPRSLRLSLTLTLSVYNRTESQVVLEGSGELAVAHKKTCIAIARPVKPLAGVAVPPGNAAGADLVFRAEMNGEQAASLFSAAIDGLGVDLVRAQISAQGKGEDLRFRMDLERRRTAAFAIAYGDEDLLTWRVRKSAGRGRADTAVADVLEALNRGEVKTDQGRPLFEIKEGRCVAVGALPAVSEEAVLIADQGPGQRCFLWDWPLDAPVLGDVRVRVLDLKEEAFGELMNEEIVRGLSDYAEKSRSTSAQFVLGEWARDRSNKKRSEEAAFAWFSKAANAGNAHAMFRLYSCYLNGRGVEENDETALTWLRQAAEGGSAKAQRQLGYYCEKGYRVRQNGEEAVRWYRRAVEQQDAAVMNSLGRCYRSGIGVAKDAGEAMKWFRRSAENGCELGQNELGAGLYSGLGGKKDWQEAAKWFRAAAEQGDANALNNLGYFYKNAIGVEKNGAEAVKWLRLALARGNEYSACRTLGLCYLEGFGVEKNQAEAVRLLRRAAELGNDDAKADLRKLDQ